MTYDSTFDTINHIECIQKIIQLCEQNLNKRSIRHDTTKLWPEEKEIFDIFTPKLKNTTYGSDEYKSYLTNMKVALDHHYKNNDHHPEHFENGISDMNMLQLLEMICDWIAASKRHADGDIFKSLEINQKRFNYSDDMKNLFKNTIEYILEMEK